MNREAEEKSEPLDIPDYTEWQREHFSGMSLKELNEKAAAYARENHTPAPGVKIL